MASAPLGTEAVVAIVTAPSKQSKWARVPVASSTRAASGVSHWVNQRDRPSSAIVPPSGRCLCVCVCVCVFVGAMGVVRELHSIMTEQRWAGPRGVGGSLSLGWVLCIFE
jgi:hypothetical protein